MLTGEEKRAKFTTLYKVKMCRDCGAVKSFTEFYNKNDSKDGFQPRCKDCQYKKFKEHYSENKDEYIKRVKKWRQGVKKDD